MNLEECVTYVLTFSMIGFLTGYTARAYFFPDVSPINDDIESQSNIPSAPPLSFSS
jgi:hypothetical protein